MLVTELIRILQDIENENPGATVCIFKDGVFDDADFEITEIGGNVSLIPEWNDEGE